MRFAFDHTMRQQLTGVLVRRASCVSTAKRLDLDPDVFLELKPIGNSKWAEILGNNVLSYIQPIVMSIEWMMDAANISLRWTLEHASNLHGELLAFDRVYWDVKRQVVMYTKRRTPLEIRSEWEGAEKRAAGQQLDEDREYLTRIKMYAW